MNKQTNRNQSRSGQQNNRNRNRKRSQQRRRPRSRGPKLSPLEKAYRTYLNLLEKHLEARKKYFSLFHRADPKQLAKLERNFNNAINELRNFENDIQEDIKEEFMEKIGNLREDNTYSDNHQLNPAHQEVSKQEAEEPHFLESQKISFQEDTEESKGTIEDYYNYKGISPEEKLDIESNNSK